MLIHNTLIDYHVDSHYILFAGSLNSLSGKVNTPEINIIQKLIPIQEFLFLLKILLFLKRFFLQVLLGKVSYF